MIIRKSLLAFCIIMAVAMGANSQHVVESFKITHGNEQKTIRCDSLNYLKITVKHRSLIATDSLQYLNGRILEINAERIKIEPTINSMEVRYLCDSNYTFKQWNSSPAKPININISDILKIEYQSKSAQYWSTFGNTSIIIGSLTTLIISPLISIDYKNGGFNSDRYLKTSAIGLGLISIGIPISIISGEKTYHFKNREKKKKTKIWKLLK